MVNGNLMRRSMTPDGNLEDERLLLRGVTAWWWQNPNAGVVEFRLDYLVYPGSEAGTARVDDYTLERRTENFRFAIRGYGAERSW